MLRDIALWLWTAPPMTWLYIGGVILLLVLLWLGLVEELDNRWARQQGARKIP